MLRMVSALALASLLLVACGGGDDGDDAADSDAQTSQRDTDDAGTQTETGETDPVCLPDGIYGKCTENLCQCVLGGDLYQYCTKPCTDTSECGEPSEFPGATPSCEPVNPGETDMICALRCATTADCPCGLECEPTYKLCSEPQP